MTEASAPFSAVRNARANRHLASLAEGAAVAALVGLAIDASLLEAAVVMACWTLVVWWQP